MWRDSSRFGTVDIQIDNLLIARIHNESIAIAAIRQRACHAMLHDWSQDRQSFAIQERDTL